MRVIVTGGGSGGHIYPAIAIADKIKEKEPQSEILYIGNDIGLEKTIVPQTGYPMKLVSAKWLDRRNIFKIFDTGFTTMKGVWQALRIMKKFKPDVVIGTGGFVCVPVMFAGHRYGARCYLHEQNAFSRRCKQIAGEICDQRYSWVFLRPVNISENRRNTSMWAIRSESDSTMWRPLKRGRTSI